MASANKKIQDRAIAHQIGILRRASSIRDRIVRHLSAVEKDIIRKIESSGSLDTFSSRKTQSLLSSIRSIIADARKETLSITREELVALAQWEAEFNKKLIQGTLGVNLEMRIPSTNVLRSVVTSRPFQGKHLREWVSNFHRAQMSMMSQAIRIGISEGETNDMIAKRIIGTRAATSGKSGVGKFNIEDGVATVSRRQAEAVVRTATNHTASAARSELYKENSDVVKNEIYVATLDSRTTPICQSLDGKIIEVGEGPRPPQHVGCRSTTSPVTKSFREMGLDIDDVPASTRASIDGQVPAKTTYADWLRRQDKETQIDVLGKTKAELFRKGSVSLDRFVDSTGNTLSIEELKARDLQAFARAGINPDEV